ncbi:TetR/AcrR family transcriptional regulator [Sphingomonas bacterium]|uniref:TetR/AcrR family transcriptional regulator n=1 Tax=Sphingomonas bacterium TaxID=1895847 RepID=UPI00157747E9|nr:TetR/AcrR family transcriptional regulator [Sphingomonas bacterium]
MNKPIIKRRGGPRTFDRDSAVETAMTLFWRHGYEGVSISDLTDAIGVAPPSLYAAFGSKAGLYREALDRYATLPGALVGLGQAESLDMAVQGLLRAAVDGIVDPGLERGCMVSTGLLECAVEHGGLARDLAARRRAVRDAVAEALSRWLDPPKAEALAGYLCVVLQGLSVQARDGGSREDLEEMAGEAMAGIRARRLGTHRSGSGGGQNPSAAPH